MKPLVAKVMMQLVLLFLQDVSKCLSIAKNFRLLHEAIEFFDKPVRLALARKDPNAFIEYCALDPHNRPVKQQWFHRVIQKMMNVGEKNALIALPRSHGKSIQVAYRAIFELGTNHNLRIKIVGSSDDKAEEILSLVKSAIETDERVQEVFPDLVILRGTKSQFTVKRTQQLRDPSVQASGVLSGGAGGRADLLIFDDVVDASNAIVNPGLRPKIIGAINETWIPLRSDFGRTVWICTPYHVQDATHYLKGTGTYEVFWEPAIKTQGGERIALWPDVWSLEKLDALAPEIGTRAFSRQYLLNALSDEERTFDDYVLRPCYEPELSDIGQYVNEEGRVAPIPDDWPTYAGLDLASALGHRAAYTVLLTLAENPIDRRLYIKALLRRKMKFTETLTEVIVSYHMHDWVTLYVENNGYQSAMVTALEEKEHITIPVEGFRTGNNKNDEIVGLPGVAVAFEQRRFVIPSKTFTDDGRPRPGLETPIALIMEELYSHPGGATKDIVMALWFAYHAWLKSSGDFEDAYASAAAM